MVVEVDPRPLARLGKEKSSTDASETKRGRSEPDPPKAGAAMLPCPVGSGLRYMRLPPIMARALSERPTFSFRTTG